MSKPNEELYPGHAADLKKHQQRKNNIQEARSDALPGPLLKAFTAPELTTLGITLRPVMHADHAILRRLDSPILKNLAEYEKPEPERNLRTSSDEEVYEFVYLFLIPARQARAELDKGRPHYRELATLAVGDKYQAVQVAQLALAARDHFIGSFATAIGYESAQTEDGTVFIPPPAAPMTASAGG